MPPKITIVTPSFNQGKYLEETILSVVGQGYPNLEYILMDGGSTDNSLDIIRKYAGYFAHWESNPDKGQADAINRGFQIATGDILAWLNSDDLYLPGALNYIANRFGNTLEPKILFGNCLRFNEESKNAFASNVESLHQTLDFSLCDYIIQPSCFWTKAVWEKVGSLNIDLVYCLDWDWFLRAKKLGINFEAVDKFLSLYRLHAHHKTALGEEPRIDEISRIYQSYHSDAIAHTYLAFEHDSKVKFVWRLMMKIAFPWKNRVMHSLFFHNLTLTDSQYDSIFRMST